MNYLLVVQVFVRTPGGSALRGNQHKLFKRACRERDWLVAEYLMQALEALAKREGRRTHADAALLDWVAQMSERELH